MPSDETPNASGAGAKDFGPYHILDLIGEGGFGSVYLAEQRSPVRRRVALKLIKPGMDSQEVIARFEAERQALAMMDHPNVAKVFDAGLTDDGRPFFAMEHVPGMSITEYCDQAKLSVRDRIALFIPVCYAVQHAHQKGIIHRDLKPSNILVTMFDGKPMPKVIDFGIAKATTGQQLTDKTLYTEAGRMIGTPEYMSPEQAGTTGLDVDTRTDVYSLGVILYQLLSGSLPFDSRQLREAGMLEVLRVIKEVEPDRLSTRLAATDTHTAAELRQADVRELLRELRGDLDWIVLRAMEKDRTRRYETANGLAFDLQRFLDHEAVLARPPSTAYRLSRFARRHRGAAVAIVLIALALIAGVVGTTWGLLEARAQADEAVTANQELQVERDEANRLREEANRQRDEAATQRTAAVTALGEAQQLTAFLNKVLALADPNLSENPNPTMRDMLDAAAGDVTRELKGQLRAEANVRATIGRAYWALGEPALASEQLRRALEILDDQGEKSPDVLHTVLQPYVSAVQYLNDDDWRPIGRRLLTAGLAAIGGNHPDLAACISAWFAQCQKGSDRSRTDAAFRAVERATEILGPEDHELWAKVGEQLYSGGWVLAKSHGAYEPAIRYAQAALEILRDSKRGRLRPTHTQAVRALYVLLDIHLWAKRYEGAEAVVREAIKQLTTTLPDAHPQVAIQRCHLAVIRRRLGKLGEAERLFAANYPLAEAGFGPDHVPEFLAEYIALLDEVGKTAEADSRRQTLAATMAASSRVLGPEELRGILGPTGAELVAAIEALERAITEDAGVEAAFVELLELSTVLEADSSHGTLVGRFLGDRGIRHHRPKAGLRPNATTAAALAEAIRLGLHSNPVKLQAFYDYASYNAAGLGDFAAAEGFARKGIVVCLEHFGARHRWTLWMRYRLARALQGLRRFSEAEPECRAVWLEYVDTQGASSRGAQLAVTNLTAALAAMGREQEAVKVQRKNLQGLIEAGAGADQLNSSAWAIVRLRNATADDYRVARTALERAVELAPAHNFAHGSLGTAHYRLGDHAEAHAALSRSDRLRIEHGLGSLPVDLLCLALARWQLGQPAEARATLERTRSLIQSNPTLAADRDNQLFLREAEELIQ